MVTVLGILAATRRKTPVIPPVAKMMTLASCDPLAKKGKMGS